MTRAGDGLEGRSGARGHGRGLPRADAGSRAAPGPVARVRRRPGDPDIARCCRRTFEVLPGVFYERTHMSDDELRGFFAMGMLMNVMSAIDLLSVPEPLGAEPLPDPRESPGHQGRQPGPRRTSPCRPGRRPRRYPHEPALTVPLFLPRGFSDQSQLSDGRPSDEVVSAPDAVPVRPAGTVPAGEEGANVEARHRHGRGHGRSHSGPGHRHSPRPLPLYRRRPPLPTARPLPRHGPGPSGRWSSPAWPCSWRRWTTWWCRLPSRSSAVHLHAGLSGLEWTVNAYTLTFAVLLLSAAALGERFGRRRIFVLGIAVFTGASAVAALAPSIGVLVIARAVQGAGGAMIMPLSLTLLSAAVPPERRNAALGIWGAIGGAAVAIGPLVGGAVTSGWSWQYIFWLNVPVGLVLIPLALVEAVRVPGRPGPARSGRCRVLSASGSSAWSSGWCGATPTGGRAPRCSFRSSSAPWRWPASSSGSSGPTIRCWTSDSSATVDSPPSTSPPCCSVSACSGPSSSSTQFLQTVQGLSPLAAGVRILPWTAMPMLLAPVVGTAGRAVGREAAGGHRSGPPGRRAGVAGHGHRTRRLPTPTWSFPS